MMDELGLVSYARYWLLLELLCEKFDGESDEIILHFNEISPKVKLKFTKSLNTFMSKLDDFGLTEHQVDGKIYKIKCPILLELQDRDFKKARKQRVQHAPKIEDRRLKIKEERIKKKEKRKIPDFDFEILYKNYPKKEGRKSGITKLKSKITDEILYERFKLALFRYSEHCKENISDKKYIKKFDTFVNGWEDWEPEDAGQVVIDLKKEPQTYSDKVSAQNADLYRRIDNGEFGE